MQLRILPIGGSNCLHSNKSTHKKESQLGLFYSLRGRLDRIQLFPKNTGMNQSETAPQLTDITDEKYEKFINQQTCPSTFPVTNLCTNPACKSEALYCMEYFCPCCYGTHTNCSNIQIKQMTEHLQSKARALKDFTTRMDDILHGELDKMLDIKGHDLRDFVSDKYKGKTAKVIKGIYFEGGQLDIQGDQAEIFANRVYQNESIAPEEEELLLGIYECELTKLVNSFRDLRRRTIRKYHETNAENHINKKIGSSNSISTAASLKQIQLANFIDSSKVIQTQNKAILNFIHQSLSGPKKLELVFRASQHNFQAHKFHQHCDGVTHTFTVVRTSHGKTIAGYTPLSWNAAPSGKHASDAKQASFLLSFDLFLKMRLTKPDYAIYCYTGFGPRFGGGADLHIGDRCHENENSFMEFPSSYGCSQLMNKSQENTRLLCGAVDGNSFKVTEYEVFKVIW